MTAAEVLEKLAQLDRDATPGPWRAGTVETEAVFVHNPSPGAMGPERVLLRTNVHFMRFGEDARVSAAIRNALPALLEALRAGQDMRRALIDADHFYGQELWDSALVRIGEALE